MEPRPQRTASLVTVAFMVVAIACAVVAGFLVSQVMQGTYSKEPVKPVVVAASSVPAGQLLRKEDLRVAHWPRSSVPLGAFAEVDAVLKVSGIPLIPFVPGEPVLASHLSKPSTGLGIAPLLAEGKRAMSIATDNPVTLARLLYPGARVDVLVTMQRHANGTGQNASTRVVLQDVKVLAVGEDIDPLTVAERRRAARQQKEESVGSGGADPDSRETRGVITLEVSPVESERLALATREGKVDVVLRNPADRAEVTTPGATPVAFGPAGVQENEGEATPSQLGKPRSAAVPKAEVRRPAPRKAEPAPGVRIIR